MFKDGKFFGREPTLWLAAITALVSLASVFGWRLLGPDQAGYWNAAIMAVAGAITAFYVRPIAPAAYTYAIGVFAQLGAAYGLHFTAEAQGMVNLAVIAFLGLLTRGQVSPIETAVTAKTAEPTPEAAKVNVERTGSAAAPPSS